MLKNKIVTKQPNYFQNIVEVKNVKEIINNMELYIFIRAYYDFNLVLLFKNHLCDVFKFKRVNLKQQQIDMKK